MPSPFPGMDPYLECPEYWQDFHQSFLPVARVYIQPQLPEQYRVRIDERLVIDAPESSGFFYPDLAVLQRNDWGVAEPVSTFGTAEVDSPAVVSLLTEPRGEAYVEIIDRKGERVVTVVEVLSPSNKRPGDGRNQYLEKQKILQEARTNLVEIDLLTEGLHTVAVPRNRLGRLTPFYSVVSIWRAEKAHQFELYPLRLQRRLPRIGIPLLPEDKDVILDIQSVFTQCYDNAAYWKDIDYTQAPLVELTPENELWRQRFLSETSQRSGDN